MRQTRQHQRWLKREKVSLRLVTLKIVFLILFAPEPALSQAQNRPELVIQTGHTSLVNSVAFSPDGKTLASGGGDNSIKVWDVASGRQIKSLVGHTSYILSVAFSPDGKMIATGGFDNTVMLWDSQSGTLVRKLEGHDGGIFSVAFSPDGSTLASGGFDKTIKLWNLETGKDKSLAGHTDVVFSVEFSPDGKTLASGSLDNSIRLWDLVTGEFRSLPGHSTGVWSVSFSSTGKMLASGGPDGTIKLWNVSTGKLINQFKTNTTILYSIVFSPDGKSLASAGVNNQIQLWDTATGSPVQSFTGHTSYVKSLAFSQDGQTLLSGSSDNTIRLWEVANGQQIKSFTSRSTHILAVAVSPDGKMLASITFNNAIKLWDLESGQIRSLEYDARGVTQINAIAFSPDGKTLASGHRDDTVKIWEVDTGKLLKVLEVPRSTTTTNNSRSGTPSADGTNITGKWILVVEAQGNLFPVSLELLQNGDTWTGVFSSFVGGGTISDGRIVGSTITGTAKAEAQTQKIEVRLKGQIENGQLIGILANKGLEGITFKATKTHGIYSIAYSPDGKIVVGGSDDNTIRVWNAEDASYLRSLEGHSQVITSLAFSPDGKMLASGSKDRSIKLWDLQTWKTVRSLSRHTAEVSSVAFSPDGLTLASAGYDKSVRLWNIGAGIQSRELPGHTAKVNSLAYSSDGRMLASGGDDRTIRIWNTESGESKTLEGHPKEISSITFSSLNNVLFSASWDATVRVWRTDRSGPLATLVSLDKNDWAVVTPDGLFDASQGARKLMHYVLGSEIVTLDQMKNVYWIPYLLNAVTKGDPLAKIPLFTTEDLFPLAEYQTPKPGENKFSVKLRNRGGGIGQVQVKVNGTEVIADARPAAFDPQTREVSLQIDLSNVKQIVPGKENKVEVIVFNASGSVSSKGSARGTELVVVGNGQPLQAPTQLYAIVGGVADYVDVGLQLLYSAKDAEDFARAIEIGASKFLGPDKVHIRLLTTARSKSNKELTGPDTKRLDATKENFRQVFAEFAAKATQNDILVVYLSGHGLALKLNPDASSEGNNYLYLTREAYSTETAVLTNEKARDATTVSGDELLQWIKEISAQKKALVLDTCAAGTAAEKFVVRRDEGGEEAKIRRLALDKLSATSGFFILLGSAGNKVSYEATPYRQGLLTYSLLEALKGARLDNDGYANVWELFDYALHRVPRIASTIGLTQQPQAMSPEVGTPFTFGLYTANEQKLFSLPNPNPIIIRPVLLNISGENAGQDNLELQPALERALRYANQAGEANQSSIVFVDSKEMADAFLPSGLYSVEGNQVTVNLKLIRNKKTVATVTVVGPVTDEQSKTALTQKLVLAISEEARRLVQ